MSSIKFGINSKCIFPRAQNVRSCLACQRGKKHINMHTFRQMTVTSHAVHFILVKRSNTKLLERACFIVTRASLSKKFTHRILARCSRRAKRSPKITVFSLTDRNRVAFKEEARRLEMVRNGATDWRFASFRNLVHSVYFETIIPRERELQRICYAVSTISSAQPEGGGRGFVLLLSRLRACRLAGKIKIFARRRDEVKAREIFYCGNRLLHVYLRFIVEPGGRSEDIRVPRDVRREKRANWKFTMLW